MAYCWLLRAALLVAASSACAGERFENSDATGGASARGGATNSGGSAGSTAFTGGRSGGAGTSGGSAAGLSASGGGPLSGAGSGGVQPVAGAASGGISSATTGGGSAIPEEGLLLWFAADRGLTESQGRVSKWLDQSGNHLDATQVAAASRPRRISSAQNGLPAVEFDGEERSLALADGFADFSQGLSFFAVAKVAEDGYCTSIMQFSNGSEVDDLDFGRFQGSIHYEVAEQYVTGSTDAFTIDEAALLGYVHDVEGRAELRLNRQFMTSGELPLPSIVSRGGNFIGRSLYANCVPLKGWVGEILMYSRALPSAERLQIETYLGKKWGCCGI